MTPSQPQRAGKLVAGDAVINPNVLQGFVCNVLHYRKEWSLFATVYGRTREECESNARMVCEAEEAFALLKLFISRLSDEGIPYEQDNEDLLIAAINLLAAPSPGATLEGK